MDTLPIPKRDPNELFDTSVHTWEAWDDEWHISNRCHNGNWPFWFLIRVIDLRNYLLASELADTPCMDITVYVASPEAAGRANVDAATRACGIDDVDGMDDPDKGAAWMLAQYGCAAVVHTCTAGEDDVEKALVEVKKEVEVPIAMGFGFYMDRPQNALGATGWDLVAGRLWPKELQDEIDTARNKRKQELPQCAL